MPNKTFEIKCLTLYAIERDKTWLNIVALAGAFDIANIFLTLAR